MGGFGRLKLAVWKNNNKTAHQFLFLFLDLNINTEHWGLYGAFSWCEGTCVWNEFDNELNSAIVWSQ